MGFKILSRFHNSLKMESVVDEIPMGAYPRPQLKRDSFISLNGRWDNNILVPYPLESSYNNRKDNVYTYSRTFSVPKDFKKDRVLLHFGAVDQVCDVYVNDKHAGSHEGGYLPFFFDITGLLGSKSVHTLRVEVTDTLTHLYPYGKQKKNPGGMWYTPVTGIWQSVWLESVPKNYIEALEITPTLDSVSILVYSKATEFDVKISLKGNTVFSGHFDDSAIFVKIKDPVLWTPDSPVLYDLTVSTKKDKVTSYFALRTIETCTVDNIPRILLNGKPFFFHGVLDQGYFPEGIYTPNCEKDYEDDILRLKSLGFNTIRKHIKIEPECFYEACDRLGMIVFQDMVNNGSYKYVRDTVLPTLGYQTRDDSKFRVKDEVKYMFEQNMEYTLSHLYNHPCIVYYTIFNEAWGQFDSDTMINICKAMDGSRIFDATSGWFAQQDSDVSSIHKYFKPYEFVASDKPVVLSEFGGFSLKIKDHAYCKYTNYGYGKAKSVEELTAQIEALYEKEIIPAIEKGLCGSIYTQITDVEEETNGLYTYDRKICKVIPERMLAISQKLVIR